MADVIRKVRNKYNNNVTADVLAEHGERVWVLTSGIDNAYTSDADTWEDIPALPVPKVGEYWGYGAGDSGLKWLVVNVNEADGHWSMVYTGNYCYARPREFNNDSRRKEVAHGNINGYTRRLPEENMVRKDDQDPYAD